MPADAAPAAAAAPDAAPGSAASADELAAAPEAVQMTDEEELSAAGGGDNSDSSKLKTLMGILKRMVGVKDIAAIRLSLPANLLEPVPNLEYWNYLDRGDLFTTIAESEDPLDRMLAALRFTFTKELKFVHGKICKPYNSILGEHFRCHWDVEPPALTEEGDLLPRMALRAAAAPVEAPARTSARTSAEGAVPPSSAASSAGKLSRPGSVRGVSTASAATTTSTSTTEDVAHKAKKGLSKLLGRSHRSGGGDAGSAAATPAATPADEDEFDDAASQAGSFKTTHSEAEALPQLEAGKRRITFLTEQVSHHPPISSFFVECKQAGVQLCGVDQLSAKFTGTAVRIFSGEQNQGIFVKLLENARGGPAGEEYQITHPTASVNGLLRGSLWVAICDTTSITCRGGRREGEEAEGQGPRLRTLVEYKDESWVMKAKYALEAVVYEYDESKGQAAEEYKRIRDVPQDRVVATLEGTWKGAITWKRKGDKDARLLIDLDELEPSKCVVRPLKAQQEMESRKIWEPVTNAIIAKDYSGATKAKQDIEQKQRDTAAERKRKDESFVPVFFDADISDGRPRLTAEGRKALDGEGMLDGYE
ncbi:hypothetical protein FA09DRAFT_299451 [Tilletiopsis washingtonensis]|uniref:Oxysterol-binding protein n=1 Tax=Tilletiopsis washingtonensis TaxID=58919 RepID=A0A316Z5A9_9BASI|nr:hypothetical protein FA09DRAFT_299451 [Tilletiopsis washingtonensis]PWN96789.1 hypothetical protein FA09DRAFT_299451 [Tilletiopsis washingtonensis]